MNKERYNQIIDEVYENYCKNVSNEIVNVGDTFIDTKRNLISTCKRKEIGTSKKVPILICEYEGCYIEEDCKKILSQEEFINRCKTDDALSIKWREEYRDFRYGSKEEIEHLSKHYKTDPEFSEKWGLKIEERELSLEERWDLSEKYGYRKKVGEMPSETETFNGVNEREEFNSMMNDHVMGTNLPTKLITLTYNNETVESYE